MSIASRQSLWKESRRLWPCLDFNTTGQSNKSRYFNTNVVPTINTSIEYLIGRNPNPALSTGWQSGVRAGWVSKAFQLNFLSDWSVSTANIWCAWNSSSDCHEYPGTSWQRTDAYVKILQQHHGKVYVNDNLVYDFNTALELTNYPIFIGDVNQNGTAKGSSDSQGSGRLFYVKIYEDDTLTHHYVPEVYNDQAGLYDCIADVHLMSTTQTSMAASTIQYNEIDIVNV